MQRTIADYLGQIKAVNTHCHHLPDERQRDLGLKELFQNSYCGWMADYPEEQDRLPDFFRRFRCNSYFFWLTKSIEELHGIELKEGGYAAADAVIRRAYQSPQHHLDVLARNCNYEAVLLDNYENPGSVPGGHDMFVPVLRCNMFAVCNHEGARDHNGNNPAMYLGNVYEDSFERYLERLEQQIAGYKALKFAIAYDDGNHIKNFRREPAAAAFGNPHATPGERKQFYDYIVYYLCQLAGEKDIVVQFHTGLGTLQESAPMYLRQLVMALPNTKFDLFHGGFPWTDDLLALMHNCKNVYANLCWLPLISTGCAERFLRELLEVADSHRILWGCDTWTAEESYGAVLAGKHTISAVLADRNRSHCLSADDALYIAGRIWRENAKELYRI